MNFTESLNKKVTQTFFCWAPLLFHHSFSFWLFLPFPFSSASLLIFSHLILFSTNFRRFWWTYFWIVVLWGIRAVHLGTSFITASKSVHYTVHVISDVGKNLWKRDYFSIVFPLYLQVAMGRSTKNLSPVTTEREQKIKIPNFQILLTPPPHIWEGIPAQEIFQQKRWELEQDWQRLISKGDSFKFCYIIQQEKSFCFLRFSAASQLPFL